MSDSQRRGCLNLSAWESLLPVNDSKKSYVLIGISEGFNVIDTLPNVSIEVGNHKYALDPSNRNIVKAQIKEELDNFQYKIVNKKPAIIWVLSLKNVQTKLDLSTIRHHQRASL